MMALISLTRHDWLIAIFLFCGVVVFSNGIHYFLFWIMRKDQVDGKHRHLGIQKYLAKPARALFFIIAVMIALPMVPGLPEGIRDEIEHVMGFVLILGLGWLAIGGVFVLQALMLRKYDITLSDNLRARRIYTQIQFLRRILIGAVVLLTIVGVLWNFHNPNLWKFGTGLLASAGLASLLLATAAKSTASNLLAGMQIALTEPIRIDDVVVINGEWGRIAEINSTYVVMNIWDQRTLIIPLSFFLEQPFTNWTRSGADLMGTAFLYTDYSVPVEPLRAELQRVVEQSPLWDKRVCGLQVTNLSERTMELRCLVSSADSGKNFDLRCLVREKMVEFIRENYPKALPMTRVEMLNGPERELRDGQIDSRQASRLNLQSGTQTA
jgi:small-conductance mechanosensitive channel